MTKNGIEYVEHGSGLFVNELGEVYVPSTRGDNNIGGNNGHFTYGYTTSRGYKTVVYKYKHYLVHRLVAECFIPNPDNLPYINHKDENKTNNNVNNLEWCTPEYNVNYGTSITRRIEKQKNNVRSKPVLQYTLEGELVKEWPSIKECGRNGFNTGNVCRCCKGKTKTHKGYKWIYKV